MRTSRVGKDLLKYLAFGGVLTLAMLSPVGGPKIVKVLLKQLKYKIRQLRNSAYYLKKRGLVEFVSEDSKGITIRITNNGKKYLKKRQIQIKFC